MYSWLFYRKTVFLCYYILGIVELICVYVCVCVCVLSHVCLFAAPWAVAHQALLSTGFPRQEYWSGLPFHTPEDLLNSGIEPTSLMSPALAGRFFTSSATWEAYINIYVYIFTYANMCLYIYIHIFYQILFHRQV